MGLGIGIDGLFEEMFLVGEVIFSGLDELAESVAEDVSGCASSDRVVELIEESDHLLVLAVDGGDSY